MRIGFGEESELFTLVKMLGHRILLSSVVLFKLFGEKEIQCPES